MTEQYSIGNKFDLVKELSFEPIGCYYQAVSLDGEKVLLLLLNSEVSEITRNLLPELCNDIIKPTVSKKDKNNVFIPIIDIIDFIEGIAIIMPFINGVTLGDYISKTKSVKLPTIKKMLKSTITALSELHYNRKFYGFLNFSTAWIADNKVYIIGYGLFDQIFNDFDIPLDETELRHSNILACVKSNLAQARITCSVFADYYSIYMFCVCLLQGYIADYSKIDVNTIIKNLNSKTKIYLTPTFCAKFCKDGVSIEQWIAKLQTSATIHSLHPLASLTGIALVSMVIYSTYQFWNESSTNTLEVVANEKIEKIVEKKLDIDINESIPIAAISPSIDENVINNQYGAKLFTAEKIIENIFSFNGNHLSKVNKDSVASEFSALEIAKNDDVSYEVPIPEQKNDADNLKCTDASCYDLISAGIKGPELSYVELGDENSLVMKEPVTRSDYYIYCYIDKTCSLKSEFDEATLSKCLFSEDCSNNLAVWLKQPMEFINGYQIKKYINWLNQITSSEYDIIPDKHFLSLATSLNPKNKCHKNNNSNFITYDGYPEWVKINDTIAFRGPIKVTADGEQCEVNLQLTDADKYLGKVFVRLIRTA